MRKKTKTLFFSVLAILVAAAWAIILSFVLYYKSSGLIDFVNGDISLCDKVLVFVDSEKEVAVTNRETINQLINTCAETEMKRCEKPQTMDNTKITLKFLYKENAICTLVIQQGQNLMLDENCYLVTNDLNPYDGVKTTVENAT